MGNEKMEEAVEHYACAWVCVCVCVSRLVFRYYILQRLNWEDEKCSLTQLLLSPRLPAEHKFAVIAAVVFFFVFVYAPTETELIIFSCLGGHQRPGLPVVLIDRELL